MMCYRDKTWCLIADDCGTFPCSARFTEHEKVLATKWWGSEEFPIMMGDLSEDCKSFTPRKDDDADLQNDDGVQRNSEEPI